MTRWDHGRFGSAVLITGGTGSFGQAMTRRLLGIEAGPTRIAILSRDELKQAEMRQALGPDPRLRWFIGDVRDRARLERAFRGISVVIHAAAMKRVDACEYDPDEAVATNITGSQNVIHAALASSTVQRVVALSSDKATAPLNLYGTTKACMEKLMLAANHYAGKRAMAFSVVRYGNVAGARGSVIPLWRSQIAQQKPITITEPDATRFWFTLDGAVGLVLDTLGTMTSGELVVPKLPSFKVSDLAAAIAPDWPSEITGHRAGDKLHEAMLSREEAVYFREHGGQYVRAHDGRGTALPVGFSYTSDQNTEWLDVAKLRWALQRV